MPPVARQPRVLQVTHAEWSDAGFGESVVQPGRGAIAEVGAYGLVDRVEDAPQHEDAAHEDERQGEVVAAVDGADQAAHGYRENSWQGAAQNQDQPPRSSQCSVSAR